MPTKSYTYESLRDSAEPLFKDAEGHHDEEEKYSIPRSKFWFSPRERPLIFHIILLATYTVFFLFGWIWLQQTYAYSRQVIYSPANAAIEYKAVVFDHISWNKRGPYFGEPSPMLDKAWHDLVDNSNIRISAEEMAHVPGREEQAIPLPDGGFLGQLNVYHEIHCIKRLHRSMYLSHYLPNLTDSQQELNHYHDKHCLDILLSGVMCRGDTSLVTMRWGSTQSFPLGNFSSPHQCVDWERLKTWAGKRRVDVLQPGYLIHPKFGPAYPDGHGDKLGQIHEGG